MLAEGDKFMTIFSYMNYAILLSIARKKTQISKKSLLTS